MQSLSLPSFLPIFISFNSFILFLHFTFNIPLLFPPEFPSSFLLSWLHILTFHLSCSLPSFIPFLSFPSSRFFLNFFLDLHIISVCLSFHSYFFHLHIFSLVLLILLPDHHRQHHCSCLFFSFPFLLFPQTLPCCYRGKGRLTDEAKKKKTKVLN